MTAAMEKEREAFEKWSDPEGKWPFAFERDAKGNYRLAQTASDWAVWQARASLASPQVPEWVATSKCVCVMGRDRKVCAEFTDGHPQENVCCSPRYDGTIEVCGHDKACHSPPQGAKP